jgi:hypothetical protein
VDFGNLIGRLGALILGLIGTVLGLIVNFGYSLFTDTAKAFGATLPASHGVIGFFAMLVGFVGALSAPFKPAFSALLLLVAGAGLFYPIHLYALIASPFLLLGALLAFIDRPKPAASKAS